MNDPISDLLTRLRNAYKAGLSQTMIPHSSLKENILKILKSQGYITDFTLVPVNDKLRNLSVTLKYSNLVPAITNLTRISTPGRRIYSDCDSIPRVLNGLGITILSTSKGLMADRDARRLRIGGVLLCNVW